MYDASALHSEIADIFQARIEQGEAVRKSWIVHEVLLAHPLPADLADRDFTECCRMVAITDAVNKVNRRFKEEPEQVAHGQLTLPGFVFLQRAYPLERDGELMLVPLAKMTTAECLAKVSLYRQMSSGCAGHADELERYATNRAAA